MTRAGQLLRGAEAKEQYPQVSRKKAWVMPAAQAVLGSGMLYASYKLATHLPLTHASEPFKPLGITPNLNYGR